MTIEKYIKSVMEKDNVTIYKLAKKSGLSQTGLSYFLNGKRAPSFDTVQRVCNALNINLAEFLSPGTSSMTHEELQVLNRFRNASHIVKKIVVYSLEVEEQNKEHHLVTPVAADNFTIPVVGKAAAGIAIEMINDPNDYSTSCTVYKPGDFAVIATGDSMVDVGINNGDRVLIRPVPVVENGEIALVSIDDGSTIKRFYKDNNSIRLVSENQKYKDQVFNYPDTEKIKIIGRFISVL